MAFPNDTDLIVTAEAGFGADLTQDPALWPFTDLSDRVVTSNPVSITRGVLVGASNKKGQSGSITLLNDDGWLTFDHPGSPWWPYVDQGTPIRLGVGPGQEEYFRYTFSTDVGAGWGAPDFTTGGDTTWAGTTGLSVTGGVGRMAHSSTNQTLQVSIDLAHRDVEVTFDASVPAVASGTSMVVGPMLRVGPGGTIYTWPLLEFFPDNTIRISLWQRWAASATQIQTPIAQPGLTYSAGTVIRCKIRYVDGQVQARAWLASGSEPTTWTLDYVTNQVLNAGIFFRMMSWRQSGNTNTTPVVVNVDNISIVRPPRITRLEGYIADIKPSFIPLGDGQTHSVVQVVIGGVGTRLERRSADAMSPTRRSIQQDAVPPIAYWPLEDKREATSAASAFPNQPPMTVIGPAVFSFDTSAVSGDRYEEYSTSLGYTSLAAGASLSGTVPASTSGEWTVGTQIDVWARGVGGGVTEIRLFEWQTSGGTHNRWALVETMTGHEVRAYNDPAGTVTTVITDVNGLGFLTSFSVTATQNGGNIDCQFINNATVHATASVAGTLGAVSRVTLNPDQVNTTGSTDPFGIRLYVGHAVVYDIATDNSQPRYVDGRGKVVLSQRAWNDEVLHERAARLCAEERIPFRVIGDPYDSELTLLGPQPSGTFTDLMTGTVESGSGDLLIEGGFGYILLPRSGRYNQDVAVSVDMATYARPGSTDPADVLAPVLGKPGANYWTVERRNGSSATYAASEAYRKRKGTIADKATLDVLLDEACGPHAQWRTHLSVDGTGATYPSFEIDLSANPGLIDAWMRCDIGSRGQWTNQPLIAGLGTIDQIFEGISETFSHSQSSGGRSWTARVDTSPATVWDTGTWNSAASLWAPSNTVLSSGTTATAVSWALNSNGEEWITGAVSIRAQLGREQVLITNISGSGSAWTFTVTRSVNGVVTAHTAGTEQIVLLDAGTWAL